MTLMYFLVNIHINNQSTLYKVNGVVSWRSFSSGKCHMNTHGKKYSVRGMISGYAFFPPYHGVVAMALYSFYVLIENALVAKLDVCMCFLLSNRLCQALSICFHQVMGPHYVSLCALGAE
jgi:hypothetical protein